MSVLRSPSAKHYLVVGLLCLVPAVMFAFLGNYIHAGVFVFLCVVFFLNSKRKQRKENT